MRFDKVALLGVGLLGGSLGLALKRKPYARRVSGLVRRPEAVSICVRRGAVDEAMLDLEPVVRDADLVVLATPVSEMPDLARRMSPWLRPGALVTDVGSVKAALVAELEPVIGRAGAHFIGSHPMAGSEKSGVDHAAADLFGRSVCIVTPTAASAPDALSALIDLWHAVGARTLRLSPELHDELVSRSSHLPHVIAAQLAHYVLDPRHSEHQALLCANGFRDSTRIASGSPQMWRDITLANREHVQHALDAFIGELGQFRDLVARGDAPGVQKFFENAKARRDLWTAWADGIGARADE